MFDGGAVMASTASSTGEAMEGVEAGWNVVLGPGVDRA